MSELTYTVGPSSQPLFIEPPHIETSPHQAPHAPNHALWMDLSTQINSLGTRMEELTVVNDTWFYSIEDRILHRGSHGSVSYWLHLSVWVSIVEIWAYGGLHGSTAGCIWASPVKDWAHGESLGESAWEDNGLPTLRVSTSTSSTLISFRPSLLLFYVAKKGRDT